MRFVQAVRRALASLPPLVRRVTLRVHLLWLVATFALASITVLNEIQAGPPSYLQVVPAIPLGGPSGVAALAIVGITGLLMLMRPFNPRKAIERELARTHAVCGRCGYALTGLDRITVCPECGEAYDQERLRRYWKWLMVMGSDRSRWEKVSKAEGIFTLIRYWGVALLLAVSIAIAWMQLKLDLGVEMTAIRAVLFWLAIAVGLDRYVGWFLLYTRWGSSSRCADYPGHADLQQGDGHDYSESEAEPGAGLHWHDDVILPSRRAWEALQREREGQ